jgi:hypothetical protein
VKRAIALLVCIAALPAIAGCDLNPQPQPPLPLSAGSGNSDGSSSSGGFTNPGAEAGGGQIAATDSGPADGSLGPSDAGSDGTPAEIVGSDAPIDAPSQADAPSDTGTTTDAPEEAEAHGETDDARRETATAGD